MLFGSLAVDTQCRQPTEYLWGGQSTQVLADLLPVTVIPYFITPKYNSLEKHLRITQSALGAELASE